MRLMCVHAHYDDFEFVAAGTFERMRRKHAPDFRAKVVVCTDGRAGHHARTREETAAIRMAEQKAAARIGGYEFELLTRPDGGVYVEAHLSARELAAPLWKVIRDFEPDYLFCPPLPADTVCGVHPDHVDVAEGIRRVAYMINVPHAFLDEYPAGNERESRWVRTPVILTTCDSYMGAIRPPDLVVDVEPVFDTILRQSWCHQSQIAEWLPWIGRHGLAAPSDLAGWERNLRARKKRERGRAGLGDGPAVEMFHVSGWGMAPEPGALDRDFQEA